MRLLYVGRYQFVRKTDGVYALPAYGDHFWLKYLDVFDGVDVLGEDVKGYLNNGTLAKITDGRIRVEILPENTNPKSFKNDKEVKRLLKKYISAADAILIKPACRKGMQAIEIAKKLNKPYMIEITGDLNLTLKNNGNPLKKLYGPIIHRQILHAIRDCKFGLYVSEKYLQKVYPIAGEQCGCTDTVIPNPEETSLQNRMHKIDFLGEASAVKIGMVASYHDTRKGLDTAVKALALLSDSRIELHVLGLGTEEDRSKWFAFARKYGIEKQLVFDSSKSSIQDVLEWNDGMDVIILPSRSEGLPRCIVESISRACPCILSNVCGMPELVNEHWLHKPRDEKKLASLLNEMINDKEKMKKAAQENYEHSFYYTQGVLRTKRNAFLMKFKEYCESKY